MSRIVVAIDGPAGAGKSTISKRVAKELGLEFIDTGAMYRAVTLKALNEGVDLNDEKEMAELLSDILITIENNRLYLDGADVSEDIRMPKVNENVSFIAAKPAVRKKLVDLQRKMSLDRNIIMDGRDIGTNVLTDANFKIFLTASVEERAMRRFNELKEKGLDVVYKDIYNEIEQRDVRDSTRELNPLKQADDAILVDTTSKSIDQVVQAIISIINNGKE